MDDAVRAVTEFWGADWPRDIVIVATASDEQFRALAGGGSDIAAATTGQRIVFAPGAAAHERCCTANCVAPRAFSLCRPRGHRAGRSSLADRGRGRLRGQARGAAAGPRAGRRVGAIPTDADLDTVGATRTLAYDRAWWFTRFVADRYGTSALRRLYERACGPGHPDIETAVSETLGADLGEVVADWRRWLSG